MQRIWQSRGRGKAAYVGAGRHGRAGQGRAGQGRAGQGKAGQGRAAKGRTEQGRAWAGQGRAGQGRAGQGRAGQGRAGHHLLTSNEAMRSRDCLQAAAETTCLKLSLHHHTPAKSHTHSSCRPPSLCHATLVCFSFEAALLVVRMNCADPLNSQCHYALTCWLKIPEHTDRLCLCKHS